MAMPFIISSRGNNLYLLRQMMWTLPFVLGNLLLQLPLSSNAFTITVSSNIASSNRNALSASSTTDSSGISSPTDNHDSHEALSTKRLHPAGSIVTIDCCLVPEGDFIPEPLFDGIVLHETCLLPEEDEQEHNDVYSSSRDSLQQEETLNSSSSSAAAVSPCQQLTFVLDQGNYLPGLHDLVAHLALGQTVSQVSLDAGWGSYNPQNVLTLQYAQAGITDPSSLRQGAQLVLQQQGGQQIPCIVTELTETTFTLDANPPLAGASYQATVTLHSVSEPVEIRPYNDEDDVSSRSDNNRYQVATFALGCFWGGELAFQRHQGVVGTAAGYTQGTVVDPTYQQVCSGTTGHTEAIAVTYDAQQVSYETLVQLAMDRLGSDKYLLNQVGNDKGTQYRHGIYYHTVSQKHVASQIVESYGPDCVTECLPATEFYRAEDYHQQYLLKGGQSARKNDPTAIRCYG